MTQKSIFSKSKISIPQSNHGKRNIKLMLVRPQKRFRTTCGVSEIITKNWIFALLLHVSEGIPAETCKSRANIQFFVIISETPQVVSKRFWIRTNISLMFLFPWLDWGIDILDFEKSIFWVMSDFGPFHPPENVIF